MHYARLKSPRFLASQAEHRGHTNCAHLGVPFHAVEADELDVEAPQRQAVLGLTYPGLLVEGLVLVCTL